MKKTLFTTLVLSSLVVLPAMVSAQPFATQLELQKSQLRPQAFNFFSDRYMQVQAHKMNSSKSFAEQLQHQKTALRPQHFNPKSDAYQQIQARSL